jgi:hypothetical protein
MQKYTEFIDRSKPQKGGCFHCQMHLTSRTIVCDVHFTDDNLNHLGLAAFDEVRVCLQNNKVFSSISRCACGLTLAVSFWPGDGADRDTAGCV